VTVVSEGSLVSPWSGLPDRRCRGPPPPEEGPMIVVTAKPRVKREHADGKGWSGLRETAV
jgi:hypothetical protein